MNASLELFLYWSGVKRRWVVVYEDDHRMRQYLRDATPDDRQALPYWGGHPSGDPDEWAGIGWGPAE